MEQYFLRYATIDLLKKIIDNIFIAQRYKRHLSTEEMSVALGMSKKYIHNGMFMLKRLKIVNEKNGLKEEIFNKLNNDYSPENLILDKIVIFPLFNEYLYLIKLKREDIEAARILKSIFKLNNNENVIKSTFNGWIKYFKIEIETRKSKSDLSLIVNKKIKNKISAISYIRKIYNDNLKEIPESIIESLIEGIINANLKPDNSLTDTGRGLEDFLRLKFGMHISLKDCSGIGQISNKLMKNKLITSKHHHILLGLSSLRSIGDAHGLDKNEDKIWEISKQSALVYSAQVIKFIRSINYYMKGFLSY